MFTLTQVNFLGLAFESVGLFFTRSWVKTFLPNIFGYCIINNWVLGTFTYFYGLLLPKKICRVAYRFKCFLIVTDTKIKRRKKVRTIYLAF